MVEFCWEDCGVLEFVRGDRVGGSESESSLEEIVWSADCWVALVGAAGRRFRRRLSFLLGEEFGVDWDRFLF